MSQLLRMQILGIRSFGPEEKDQQSIKFFSPVTLIQGQNGCGKTTIIEAIKFAITGDLPGGSMKGQGFVYDPKLAKTFETLGQVKVRVCDTKGEWITVSKSVCVKQKRNKLEFSRLDSTISRGRPGSMEHISGKCIDIDAEMCTSLGVSKAILNNVIFCHQEDSNWPLDEGKKLKEKFDEIFDATKYTKCYLATQKFMKSGLQNIKLLEQALAFTEERKKEIESKRQNLSDKEARLAELNTEITLDHTNLKTVNTRIKHLVEIELNFSKLCTEVEMKKKDINNLVEQQADLLKNIKEFFGTDEELQDAIVEFEKRIKDKELVVERSIRRNKLLAKEMGELREKINNNQNKLGSLQSEKNQNDKNKESRNKLILKAICDFKLDHTIKDIDAEIPVLIQKLEDKLKDTKKKIKLLEENHINEEKQLQNEIDVVRVEHAQIQQDITLKNKTVNELKNDLRKLQQTIEELNSAGDQLIYSETRINRLEKELASLETSVDTNALRKTIESENKKQKELEDRLTSVDSEVQILQQYTSLQTELDLKNDNLFTKQNDLQKLKHKHEKAFNHIFKNDIPSELKKNVQAYQITQNASIKSLTNQINEKQREVLKLESNLNNKREKLKEKQIELDKFEKKLEVCEHRDLEDIIDEQQTIITNLQNDKAVYYSSRYLYKQYIKEFQANNPSCPICKRGVDEPDYVNTIIDDLNKKIQNFPAKTQQIEEKLKQETSKHQKLINLRPINEKLIKLKTEIPDLQSETEICKRNYEKTLKELENLKESIKEPQNNEKIVHSVLGDVSLIDQLNKDLQVLRQEISSLNLRLPKNESNRGIQEALNEQEGLKIDIKNCRMTIQSSQNKLTQHSERLQRLRENKNDLVTQQLQIKQNLQGKDNLISKSTETEKKIEDLKNAVQQLEILGKETKLKLEAPIKKKEKCQQNYRIQMDQIRKQISSEETVIENIRGYERQIDSFNSRNIPEQLSKINDVIESLQKEIKQKQDEQIREEKIIDECKSEISNSHINFRELKDNVKLREKRKEQYDLEKELEVLEKNLGNNDITSVREEKTRFLRVERTTQERLFKNEGQKTELAQNISEISEFLNEPKNKNIHSTYKSEFIKLELSRIGMDNLREYLKAMDWALMQFHKEMMSQINEIIKTLWRSIYKGNDIDFIQIKTDDETVVGTDKRKIYNYKIVQFKNDTELDMRGRCSAGQRVLACLVIRIALSETFSNNCGILALDEPTTNLDRENIYSLSEALVQLIQEKSQQKNFQLLIITHDEDFVNQLTSSESLQEYYIVRRNDFGKSVISLKR